MDIVVADSAPTKARINHVVPGRRLELAVVLVVMVLVTLVFRITDWDRQVQAFFYAPGAEILWPYAEWPPFVFSYKFTGFITGILGLSALTILLLSRFVPFASKLKPYAALLMLTIIIGPGVVINATLKDHWGRARPHQIVDFGGRYEFSKILDPGTYAVGKSFPCGHASIGFLLCVFWFALRRRAPQLARYSLLGSLVLGMFSGVGRMAAGAHFLSDVFYAGFITYLSAFVAYYGILRIPRWEKRVQQPNYKAPPTPRYMIAAYAFAGVGLLGGALLANPQHKDLFAGGEPGDHCALIEVKARQVDVVVTFDRNLEKPFDLRGRIRSFGLPTNEVEANIDYCAETAVFSLEIDHAGVFTEYVGEVTLTVNPDQVDKLKVDLEAGDILYGGDQVAQDKLHLETGAGDVQSH